MIEKPALHIGMILLIMAVIVPSVHAVEEKAVITKDFIVEKIKQEPSKEEIVLLKKHRNRVYPIVSGLLKEDRSMQFIWDVVRFCQIFDEVKSNKELFALCRNLLQRDYSTGKLSPSMEGLAITTLVKTELPEVCDILHKKLSSVSNPAVGSVIMSQLAEVGNTESPKYIKDYQARLKLQINGMNNILDKSSRYIRKINQRLGIKDAPKPEPTKPDAKPNKKGSAQTKKLDIFEIPHSKP